MLSDDTYRTRLARTIEDLVQWARSGGGADIEQAWVESGWRLAVMPHAANACPFELLLRRDQRYDLAIAGETYEDQAIESLDIFRPLVEAIAAGSVVVRRRLSAATGTLLSVDTLIWLADGALWRGVRETDADRPGAEPVGSDRHYVPYRRA